MKLDLNGGVCVCVCVCERERERERERESYKQVRASGLSGLQSAHRRGGGGGGWGRGFFIYEGNRY